MLSPRRRASDRTGGGLEHVGDHDACFSALDIHVKFDVFEKRGMDGARHHPIDPPMGRPLVGLATVQDGSKSVSLLAVRPLIDDGLTSRRCPRRSVPARRRGGLRRGHRARRLQSGPYRCERPRSRDSLRAWGGVTRTDKDRRNRSCNC